MNNPLLSIVIPTHNRRRYLIPALMSILRIESNDCQVIVSDTSDKDIPLCDGGHENEVARKILHDHRVVYHRPSERLDMTGNHNRAMSLATGRYVCLIGDDDSVSGEIIPATRWAEKMGLDSLSPNVVANYAWPDFRSKSFGDRHAGRLYITKFSSAIRRLNPSLALARALANAAQGTEGLPKVYHGIVRREILEVINRISGAYFHGSSPDVSGGIGVALVAKRCALIDRPITIPGASGGSNTGRSAMNQHKGKLEAESQTACYKITGWSQGVPKFFSVETVWAHAAIETISRMDLTKSGRFNFSRLIAICQLKHPEYAREIARAKTEAAHILGWPQGLLRRCVSFEMTKFLIRESRRLALRAMRPTAAGGRRFHPHLATINDAAIQLERDIGMGVAALDLEYDTWIRGREGAFHE